MRHNVKTNHVDIPIKQSSLSKRHQKVKKLYLHFQSPKHFPLLQKPVLIVVVIDLLQPGLVLYRKYFFIPTDDLPDIETFLEALLIFGFPLAHLVHAVLFNAAEIKSVLHVLVVVGVQVQQVPLFVLIAIVHRAKGVLTVSQVMGGGRVVIQVQIWYDFVIRISTATQLNI
jgi:hypothetical protein